MTLPVPTKIRAVIEVAGSPTADCYPTNDVASLAALEVSKVFSSHQPTTTKETITMQNQYAEDTFTPVKKTAMPGIGAGSVGRHIDTLNRLGLCPSNLATSLQTLAAAGQPIDMYFQVSVYDLDRALSSVDCSVEQRLLFKSSLKHQGLLK